MSKFIDLRTKCKYYYPEKHKSSRGEQVCVKTGTLCTYVLCPLRNKTGGKIMERDIKEVRCFKTKDGKVFPDRTEAEKHDHSLKVRKMREEFVQYAETLLKDIMHPEYCRTRGGDYSDGILRFEDMEDIVTGAMTIVDLWDGRFLGLIKYIEGKIKKV